MSYEVVFPEKSKILFAPLNWGLGHASRSVPLIQKALNTGCTVYIASDGIALKMLKSQLLNCTFLELPGYNIQYKYDSVLANIFVQFPKLIATWYKEHDKINEIVNNYSIDIIVSDNRFGCYSAKCTSVYITHQLTILHASSWIGYVASLTHSLIMKNFDQIWVPDFNNKEGLSGKLGISSFTWLKIIRYIGPLTRLNNVKNKEKGFSVLSLLSGPEPQRTWLELKLANILKPISQNTLFIRGTDSPAPESIVKFYHYIDLAGSSEIEQAISDASVIICRSGYSTIMDLAKFEEKFIIYIPTPGQTEQEYLASYHEQKSDFIKVIEQKNLDQNLLEIIKEKIC